MVGVVGVGGLGEGEDRDGEGGRGKGERNHWRVRGRTGGSRRDCGVRAEERE